MRLFAALLVSVSALAAQTSRSATLSVTAVRHWSMFDVTRVAIEVSGEFEFRTDRLHNPERIYFDILNARPQMGSRRVWMEPVEDKLLTKIRVAETQPDITRVVLDLSGLVDATTSQLTTPDRLIIELKAGTTVVTATESSPAGAPSELPPAPVPSVRRPDPSKSEIPRILAKAPTSGAAQVTSEPSKTQLAKPGPDGEPVTAEPAKNEPSLAISRPAATPRMVETGKAARHTSTGDTSLVRALGLKLNRVVIDPGHGGHDQGTQGVRGLLEKDLVLDVSKRVGKLIEEKLGAEVIYTRSDDTFIPLTGRTALANEKKADLFLSIHANSSPVARITGVETYYLNFTDSQEALDVASRENASYEKSIFELRDIIQKISLHEKAEESKEFANRMQSSLYALSARNFPGGKNRGVKKAPFVVLIGAQMPSILAEIGFLTNTREEALLKRPDYRQKVAESLFRGVQKYAESLSHFDVARAKE
jgi:N-acetylmuramoyl-L-alanine amidase